MSAKRGGEQGEAAWKKKFEAAAKLEEKRATISGLPLEPLYWPQGDTDNWPPLTRDYAPPVSSGPEPEVSGPPARAGPEEN